MQTKLKLKHCMLLLKNNKKDLASPSGVYYMNNHAVHPFFVVKKNVSSLKPQQAANPPSNLESQKHIEPTTVQWNLSVLHGSQKFYVYVWLARVACFINFLPFLFIARHEEPGLRACVCVYLSMMPFTSFVLHTFTSLVCLNHPANIVVSVYYQVLAIVLGQACIIFGNVSAVFFLQYEPKQHQAAYFFLSLSLSLGSIQLLVLLNKNNVLRVMFCTASSVLIVILNVLAFQSASSLNTSQSKRFYQSSSLPFLLLYLEMTRSHYPIASK